MRSGTQCGLIVAMVALCGMATGQQDRPMQYLLVNRIPGCTWRQEDPATVDRALFCEVRRALPEVLGSQVRVGLGFIFSYLGAPHPEDLHAAMRKILYLSQETEIPVFIQFDGDNWWGGRPDLWNWWDPSIPGYDPQNRENVEWTSWDPKDAVKIAWRNWGTQIRVYPPPNLMSPAYQNACREGLAGIIPIVVEWWHALPEEDRWLLAGVKVGHESSIGVNAWVYPGWNDLCDQPSSSDPITGVNAEDLPSRGVVQIGYAAAKSAGIRDHGDLTESDLAEVVRRHLELQSQWVALAGIPKDRLFTHCGGWKQKERLFQSSLNEYACPGWSFYARAEDPRQDEGVQEALQRSTAPFWGAVEWLYMGSQDQAGWERALRNTLSDPRCRILCVYNWEGIRDNQAILEAMRRVMASSATWQWPQAGER